MCGIFGYIGEQPFDGRDIKILALYNESRGLDAFGIYNHNKAKKNLKDRIKKHTVKGKDTLTIREDLDETRLLIGHTRNKSTGTHAEKNIHPFHFEDNICGVHNGTINNYEELAKKYEVKVEQGDSDSRILYKILGKTGGNFDVLSDIDGTASLAFTLNDEKLYLFRKNTTKPLYYAKFRYVESDKWAAVFSSLQYSIEAIGIDSKQVEELNTEEVLEFDQNGQITGRYKIEDNKEKPKVQTYTGGYGSTYTGEEYYGGAYRRNQKKGIGQAGVPSKKGANVTRSLPIVKSSYIGLNTLYITNIFNDTIVECRAFEGKGIYYTKYILHSGAIAVIKGGVKDPETIYNRSNADKVINGSKCLVRNIKYDLLLFKDGSFIEQCKSPTGKSVHEQEVSEEEPPFRTQEEEEEEVVGLDRLWKSYSDIASYEAELKNQVPPDFDPHPEQLESSIDDLRNGLMEIQENILKDEKE